MSRFPRVLACAAVLFFLGCGDDTTTAGGGSGAGTSSSSGGAPNMGGAGGAGGAPEQGGSPGTGGGGAPNTTAPAVGAHGLSYYGYGANQEPTLDSPALSTQSAGSTLIVSVGRGDASAFALPTDNKGNTPFLQLGVEHPYSLWPGSGTAVYAFADAVGGDNHVITTTNAPGDEITMAVVEVAHGTHIQDQQWVEVLSGSPLTSAKVHTTGPAALVAFWWGDAGVDGDKVATPNNGFTVLDSIGTAGALVQCFVAAKTVSQAGDYDVTWEATPQQGAQLWLVAVQ
ncbi:MAG: hypothetical protein U0271_11665 [Polyangiaceae bacterium]